MHSYKHMIGFKSNKLTVIGDSPTKFTSGGNRVNRVQVKCDCGVEKSVPYKEFKSGRIKSCGCMASKEHSIVIGDKFGFWTVIKKGAPYIYKKKKQVRYICECSCGKQKLVIKRTLINGKSNSCGCMGNPRKKKLEKVVFQDPIGINDERWVPLVNVKGQWISSKGRRYFKSTGIYSNIKMGSKISTVQRGRIAWINSIYKSFNKDFNNKIEGIGSLDEDITNFNLDNIYKATRTLRGPDWVSYLQGNTKSSSKLGLVSKARLLELFKIQNGKSYFLGLDLDMTCSDRLLAVSVDRLDNNKGYSDDNVVLSTRFENIGRGSSTVEDMQKLCKLINNKNPSRKKG